MAVLWGGRFTKETEQEVFLFNESFSFDKRLIYEDIEGSLAHAAMLVRQGILTMEEGEAIKSGLTEIRDDLASGALLPEGSYEDVHSFIEAVLTERIGEAGKKLHTGRSRNDQVALDMRLYTKKQAMRIRERVLKLLKTIYGLMEEHTETIMPGFTHLQKAQPTTLAHHLGTYFEMLRRDYLRLSDLLKRMDESPLGSGALAGTTYPLDRDFAARELGFSTATFHSMDGVSDRDYLLELLSALSILMMHLSRFSEEIILWNSNEYRFLELDDAYSTGSSIMPQKKNPDIAELVRGKTGRVYGALVSLLTVMKGLPLAYNKDMQEDKELSFDAMDTAMSCLALFDGMLATAKFHKDIMRKSAAGGFTNATDAADYLVGKGVAFRDAHGIIGRMVLLCIEKDKTIKELSIKELKELSPAFGEDFYEAVTLEACVERRNTKGAPGKRAMQEYLQACKDFLNNCEKASAV